MRHTILIVLLTLAASSAPAHQRYSDARCAQIEKQVQKIHSQMRAGYSAKKGIRLADSLLELRLNRTRHCP